jgi:amphi-Trp domain-containing protein
MADVKLERKESVSRDEAAIWLSLLSKAFAKGDHAELPFGPGTVSLQIPHQVRAELEVEVDGDEVEVEVEFKWSLAEPEAPPTVQASGAAQPRSRQASGSKASARSPRSQR